MEVSGKKKETSFSASCGSAEDFLLFCIPCDSEGVREPAHGYCKNCKEHLCETCYKHHRKPAPLRKHVLLDKDSMPNIPSVSNTQDDFDYCSEHENEKLKFYCKDHSNIVCGVCIPLNHRTCKAEYIPKLSKNILGEGELTGLIAELTTFHDTCKSKLQKATEHVKSTAENHKKLLKEIKHFRKKLDAFLDEMELTISQQADSVMNAEQNVFEKSSADLEDIIKKTEIFKSDLESLKQKNHLDKLFVEMKNTEKQLKEIRAREIEFSQTDEFLNLRFVGNQSIFEKLQSQTELGILIQGNSTENKRQKSEFSTEPTPSEDKTVVLKYIGDFYDWSQSFKKKMHVTGLEYIQPDKLVACDYSNCKVKCYDTVKRKVVSEEKLLDSPFDVTSLNDNKIAVTVPDDKCIYFMSVTGSNITSDKIINVDERCYVIAYSQENLVVSCKSNIVPGEAFIMINLNGEILQIFSGDELFCFPKYITTNSAGTYMYISDSGYKVKAVHQLDLPGNVVNKCAPSLYGETLRRLCELDDGTFLVCLCIDNENNVVRLSSNCSNCKPCKVTGHEKVGKWFPQAVTYCKENRMLYVSYSEIGDFSSNRIKTFKVEWR